MIKIDLRKIERKNIINVIEKTLKKDEEIDFVINDELSFHMDFIIETLIGRRGVLKDNHYILKTKGECKMLSTQEKIKTIKVALAGSPNSGKSTLFNALTGGHAHVGNWPGVTVEKKEGELIYEGYRFIITDLPGTYSLTSYSIDEKVARDFIVKEKPDVVVSVVDATNIEKNLYLTISLLELGANVVLDLNMVDILRAKNVKIDKEKLQKLIGVPVVLTAAVNGEGVTELKEAVIKASKTKPKEFKIDYGKEIEEAITVIENEVKKLNIDFPSRFIAIKLLEGDGEFIKMLQQRGEEKIIALVTKESAKLENKFGYDIETEIIERRYGFIESIALKCISKRLSAEEKLSVSDKIDRVVTNKWLGIPLFALVMWGTFQLTFTVGGIFADWIDQFFGWLSALATAHITGWLGSLIGDGIIGGVGTVLVFLPNIMILFLLLAFLEDSGYMARAAFIMDRAMHAIGLPGKSFIPMIIGFGCNVPAIMSTRTISSERDRLLTILINPFVSCSARLPVYLLFTSVFFKSNRGLVVFSLYAIGILVAVLSAKLFKSTIPKLKGPVSPLVMELPPYRWPTVKGILIHMWERSSAFVKKAGTIIVAGVIVIWFLARFPLSAEYAGKGTYIWYLGRFFAPLLKPAGFGFWQAAVALFFGIIAKETVVGTMGTLFGGSDKLLGALVHMFTPLSAYSFMIMSLLYIPCIATIGVIYRETNSWKWTAFSVAYSILIGWGAAVLFYQIGQLIL